MPLTRFACRSYADDSVVVLTRSCGSPTTPSASSLLHGDGRFSIELALFLSLSLIVELLSAHDGDLDFDFAAFEIEPQRDDRQSLLGDLLAQFFDLAPMEQQLALPLRLIALNVDMIAPTDVRVEKKLLIVFDDDVRDLAF